MESVGHVKAPFISKVLTLLGLILIVAIPVSAQYGDLSQPGRYLPGFRSVTVTRTNSTTFTARLYYPAVTSGQNAAINTSGAPYPAITFGHGFLQAVSTYQSSLEHLASHGYIVIASDSESGLFPNHQNFANDLRSSLDHLTQQNANSSSILFGQVATDRYGASGHSMGGGASILAASQDSRIKALANLAAAETNPSATAAMPAITAPVSLISASSDTIVPVSTNGQVMYNAGRSPKLLPVIQGGWHCGFQDSNGFGCDTGSILRSQQLAETRRLLTAFFDLYLKRDELNWKSVWGDRLRNSLVTASTEPFVEIVPATLTEIAPVGRELTLTFDVTNRSTIAESYSIVVEQRRWAVQVSPAVTAMLQPGQSTAISLRLVRRWKNPRSLNDLLISVRRNSDQLTRTSALLTLQ